MTKKYLKLMLTAPSFFTGKTIEHNNFTIEYNFNYTGEQNPGLALAIKEISDAARNCSHPTRIFDARIIEDNIDMDNLPYKPKGDEMNIWFDLRELGFKIESKYPSELREWSVADSCLTSGWLYRISPDNTFTLDN